MVSSEPVKSPTLLNISALTFAYGAQSAPVLSNFSLNVQKGEIVAILGRSGCGKSTLLNLIAGLLSPQNGEITVEKHGVKESRIGYIFQEDALLPWRTVQSNLSLATEIGGVSKEGFQSSLTDFLNAFHLEPGILNAYPSTLSGGMRQRVSIIQALLFNPQLLLLDEAFSALDFYTKLRLESEFFNFIKKNEKAALFVTHDIEEAIAISDRVVILNVTGSVHADIAISFAGSERDPEVVRGKSAFSEYYRMIWGELKGVISQ
jgi:NitT/TauT family transport system ATP-binding protein